MVIPWGKGKKKKRIIFRAAKKVGNNSWDRENTVLGESCAESRHAGKSNRKETSERHPELDYHIWKSNQFTPKADLRSLRLETTGHRLSGERCWTDFPPDELLSLCCCSSLRRPFLRMGLEQCWPCRPVRLQL